MTARDVLPCAGIHRRTAGRAALLVLIAVALSACGPGVDGIERTDSDPPLLVHGKEGGEDAQVAGFLRYLEEQDCFVLEDEGGAHHNVPVWPAGSEPVTENGSPTGVDVAGYGEVEVGQWILGGGGYINPETSDVDLPEGAADCLAGDGEVATIDGISEVSDTP